MNLEYTSIERKNIKCILLEQAKNQKEVDMFNEIVMYILLQR